MTSYKIILTGARSKTAESLTRFIRFETVHELVLLSRDADSIDDEGFSIKYNVDITDTKHVKKICFSEKPDFIINTSSMNDIFLAEKKKKDSWKANVVSVENLVNVSRILDCILIHVSCEHIFNGRNSPYTEDNLPEPLNYLGKCKHAAENTCLARHHKSAIVRASPVYGWTSHGMYDFVSDLIYNLKRKRKVAVSDTYQTTPSFSDDIARVILKIIDKQRLGIFNAGGPDLLSHKNIAEKISDVFNFDKSLIETKPHSDVFPVPAIEKGGLINLKAETDLGIKFTSFENGILSMKNKMQIGKKRLKK